jgi:pimeloyl-ACP methyl ester carboxylesterase
LIIAGDDDPLVATFNPRLMARFLRRSTLHVVPGSGHLVLLDSPDIVGPVINTFLDAETS